MAEMTANQAIERLIAIVKKTTKGSRIKKDEIELAKLKEVFLKHAKTWLEKDTIPLVNAPIELLGVVNEMG